MRISYSVARNKKKKRIYREAKGRWGARKNLWRTVIENVERSRCVAYRDRRIKKRDFRSLWITRISGACEMRGMRYSQFIHGLELANIALNRKVLSELAFHHPAVFDEVFAKVAAAVKADEASRAAPAA